MSEWAWRSKGYDPDEEGLRESLCTVGNGYMATRGAAPECPAGPVHYPGTYVAGVYNRLETEVEGERVTNESLVNVPNWLAFTFRVDGGAWFGIDDVEVLEHDLRFDLRRSVLHRRTHFRDGDGRTTTLTQRRFVSMASPHVGALESTVRAEDWSGTLEVRAALDGTVENTGVERYRELASDHLLPTRTGSVNEDAVLLEVETNHSHVRVAMAARTRALRNGVPVDPRRTLVERERWVAHDLALDVEEGDVVTVEKVVTVFTGRDRAISEPANEAVLWLGRTLGFEELLERHVRAWAHLWERFHFDMNDREETLRTIRLHLSHVLASVSLNSVDLDVGVPPRGLHGEAYRGHIFWDELFVFPVLNLRLPLVTRSLLRYRYRRLDEARAAARAAGLAGAMYPWQSASNGREESQQLHLNPVSNHWLVDPSRRQCHVGIAIAYNVWQYYQATDDREFLTYYGAEMLVEIARFWASLAAYDHSRNRYVIKGVIGPDEFHSGYPEAVDDGVDNNAYTNVMAAWVLRRAQEALALLPDRTRRELLERLDIDRDERDRWDDVSRRMFVPFHDGTISQFEGYEQLEELDWDRYRRRYGNIQRLDRILESEGDDVNRYKASKQADVLMLFYLLSADEFGELLGSLGYPVDTELIPRTIDYYLERTSHGSTLSAVVHAWVLARAHRHRATELFVEALDTDVADIQGGTTAEGVHLGAMAGSVDLLQRCFSGVETRGGQLVLDPYWPEDLGTLEFTMQYRGHPLRLQISGAEIRIEAGAGMQDSIQVACREAVSELRPGSSLEFRL